MWWISIEWHGLKGIGMTWKYMKFQCHARKLYSTNRMECWNDCMTGWVGMVWHGIEWNGMTWKYLTWNGMEWNGKEWNDVERYEVERQEIEWNVRKRHEMNRRIKEMTEFMNEWMNEWGIDMMGNECMTARLTDLVTGSLADWLADRLTQGMHDLMRRWDGLAWHWMEGHGIIALQGGMEWIHVMECSDIE